MSLFSALHLANNTLRATQVGLQVVGQNIANTNTPGYIRERAIYAPSPVQKIGDLVLGTGVEVTGIVQQLDKFVMERLRGALSDRASTGVQEDAFRQLETILGELSDTDLSTSLTSFFASIAEVLNQPESEPVRNLAVLRGQTLAGDINSLDRRVRNLREDVNDRVLDITDEINTLTEEIATLNLRIAYTEAGEAGSSDAGALRVQRNNAIERLAEIVDIRASEQRSSAVNVSVGGEFLVFEGDRREVSTVLSTDRGLSVATVQFTDTQSPLVTGSGELTGLYEARDTIVAGFSDQVERFSQTLIYEFNKAYSQGQGLSGFQQLTSEHAVSDADQPLDESGLPFTPVNGAFDIVVHNTRTAHASTHTILVDLNGLDDDLSLAGLAQSLDAIEGITASVSPTGSLTIQSDSSESEFAFSGDTSGVLAALGINTFFSGTGAGDVGVNQVLIGDAGKFAASRGGIGEDTENAVRLAGFLDEPLPASGGLSLSGTYDQITNELTQGSSAAAAVSEGFRVYEETVRAEHLSISSVNLDEEAIRMIVLQRVFQASARYIQSVTELLDYLVNL